MNLRSFSPLSSQAFSVDGVRQSLSQCIWVLRDQPINHSGPGVRQAPHSLHRYFKFYESLKSVSRAVAKVRDNEDGKACCGFTPGVRLLNPSRDVRSLLPHDADMSLTYSRRPPSRCARTPRRQTAARALSSASLRWRARCLSSCPVHAAAPAPRAGAVAHPPLPPARRRLARERLVGANAAEFRESAPDAVVSIARRIGRRAVAHCAREVNSRVLCSMFMFLLVTLRAYMDARISNS